MPDPRSLTARLTPLRVAQVRMDFVLTIHDEVCTEPGKIVRDTSDLDLRGWKAGIQYFKPLSIYIYIYMGMSQNEMPFLPQIYPIYMIFKGTFFYQNGHLILRHTLILTEPCNLCIYIYIIYICANIYE